MKTKLSISVVSAVWILAAMGRMAVAGEEAGTGRFEGQYCSGAGDAAWLRLIDESFAFFHANPQVPNLTMVYQPDWDTFQLGANWDAWWIQNSYGFTLSAVPFLPEPYFSILQRSYDLFWHNQGDGRRMGLWYGSATATHLSSLVGPDGCLGDAARPGEIAYKQGDGDAQVHDWFYEATAAGVVMQAEILLANRDTNAMARYLPKMDKACDFIERARDPKNNLFLVGPGCNLLAPSYGGVKQPDGTFGKGYLAGLSITYLAAMDRMVELYRLTGDQAKLAEYERRQKVTRESLPQLLTPAGYFVKSIEPGGVKHGVLGQAQYGYLEGVANADAVALRVADQATAEAIYRQIAAFRAIRPFDWLLTNAPGLDDTYWLWGAREPLPDMHAFGQWVNGGVWATVEARAILAYYRLGKFEDVRRSADRAMKWAKECRMDAPWSQRGENTYNLWADRKENPALIRGLSVTHDNFAIPAATIRGLFDCEYRWDRLILRPRVPEGIKEYVQKEPIRFGEKRLYVSCRNGGMEVQSVAVNGQAWNLGSSDEVVLPYETLPATAHIEIVTEGGWPAAAALPASPPTPAATTVAAAPSKELPESLRQPYAALQAMEKLLAKQKGVEVEQEQAFVHEALAAIEARRARTAVEAQGFFRPMTIEKRDNIVRFYEDAALAMYRGFARRMSDYENSPVASEKRLGELFQQVVPVPEKAVTLPKGGQSKDADANTAWGGAPIDNGADLLKKHVISVTTDGRMLLDSRLANINDGVLISNGGIADTTTNLSVFTAGSKVVFKLDAAYDIGRIDVFTVHCQRNGQKYTVDTSADGGTTWTPLTAVSCDNLAADWKVRRIRLTGRNGAALAKGVSALRFTIAIPGGKPPYDTYDSVYGEIAVYAAPGPAAPGEKR
jgi:hypothetical protein